MVWAPSRVRERATPRLWGSYTTMRRTREARPLGEPTEEWRTKIHHRAPGREESRNWEGTRRRLCMRYVALLTSCFAKRSTSSSTVLV